MRPRSLLLIKQRRHNPTLGTHHTLKCCKSPCGFRCDFYGRYDSAFVFFCNSILFKLQACTIMYDHRSFAKYFHLSRESYGGKSWTTEKGRFSPPLCFWIFTGLDSCFSSHACRSTTCNNIENKSLA